MFQWYTPEHAGDINRRAEEGLEKACPLLWYTPITALGMQLLGLAHTISFLEGSLGFLWMWNLDFRGEAKKGSPGESNYISQLRRRLTFAHKKARHMAQRQQAKHQELYDMKCRGTTIDVGDLVLVKQTVWKGRHKIQDRWESGEYQVVGQPTPGVPVYTVKRIAGGKTKVLHRNLLLPLQGRIRQTGEMVEEGVTDSEEEEGRAVIPKVARVPKGSPRVTTKPQDSPTPADPNASSLTDPSAPESISGDEDSNGKDDLVYNTDSLTSHTTASSSTSADMLSVEANNSISPSVTESKFNTIMPYLEESDHTTDSVFLDTETSLDPHVSQHISQSPTPTYSTVASSPLESPVQSPAPRRSPRSTWGAPQCALGKLSPTALECQKMTNTPTYRQTLYVSCMANIVLT